MVLSGEHPFMCPPHHLLRISEECRAKHAIFGCGQRRPTFLGLGSGQAGTAKIQRVPWNLANSLSHVHETCVPVIRGPLFPLHVPGSAMILPSISCPGIHVQFLPKRDSCLDIWAETSMPFFSQMILGMGMPSAWHRRLAATPGSCAWVSG